MDSERMLPNDRRLNTGLKACREAFGLHIDEIKDAQEGDIVSFSLEFGDVKTLINFGIAATVLQEYVMKEKHQASESIYRSIMFSLQTIGYVMEDAPVGFKVMEYIQSLYLEPNGHVKLRREVEHYLTDNATVRQLLTEHIEDIDQGRGYETQAFHSGGMIFMLAERSLQDKAT